MRKDMGRIAVDAYRFDTARRLKDRRKNLKVKHKRDEFIASKNVKFIRTSHPGENLSPLNRWLDKQVGRKYNDVYSEMNKALKGGYTNLEHIKTHVEDRIKKGEIRFIDDWPYSIRKYTDGFYPLTRDELYVDHDGILRNPPKDKQSPQEKRKAEFDKITPKVILIDNKHAIAKINGIWFLAALEDVGTELVSVVDWSKTPRNVISSKDYVYKKVLVPKRRNDVLLNKIYSSAEYSDHHKKYGVDMQIKGMYNRNKFYATSLKTMSKSEIKKKVPKKYR